jgi:circadian clock protein KaiC
MFEYRITDKGVVIGEPLRGYRALTSGVPGPWSFESEANDPDPKTSHPPDRPKAPKAPKEKNQ